MARDQCGTARVKRAERTQMQWRPLALDQLIEDDHNARLGWAYVEQLDLSELYAGIRAVEGAVGQPAIDPRILVALWLQATIDGIGSARELDRRCQQHFAYLWLCGGVGVNYHTLSDFRVAHEAFLEGLLVQSVTTLLHEGLIKLDRIAQDGMRVRASAGSSSFRREESLERCLQQAQQHWEEIQTTADEDDGRVSRRQQAARERAARERTARLQAALVAREEVAQKMERRQQGSGEKARASSTDPESRRMKMADGGFRPAYNVQFATTCDSLVIVAADVINQGSDAGQMQPMIERIKASYGQKPREYLADGGFSTRDDIIALEQADIAVHAPLKDEAKIADSGRDPFARRPGDTDEIAAWRARMATDEAKAVYAQRAATAEFPNAGCRNRGLHQFVVRGLQKVRAITLWQALAHNFQRTLSLRQTALATAP